MKSSRTLGRLRRSVGGVDLLEQPHPRHDPVPLGGAGGDVEDGTDFVEGEASDVVEFFDASMTGCDLFQPIEGLIQGDKLR